MIKETANLHDEMELQERLDNVIYARCGVDPKRKHDERILAIIDEICELMNKMRVHKYWSKQASEAAKEDLLEEYVDTWHFILSVGNEIDMPYFHYGLELRGNYTKQFRAALFAVNNIFVPAGWKAFVSIWKGLGVMMGFTEEEVRQAYVRKHAINMERQRNGY